MRSFEKCLPNLYWQVFRLFPNADMYICTQPDEDAKKAELVRSRYPNAKIRVVEQPEMVLPDGCPEVWNPGAHYMHEPYAISVSPAAVMGQLWMLREAWTFYLESGMEHELIIRCRPDLWFLSFEKPAGVTPEISSMAAFTPRWGKFGGINDRFALLGRFAAESYFQTYDDVPAMVAAGAPIHPETLVAESLRRNGVIVDKNMVADFATRRTDGNLRPPEIMSVDVMDARRS